MQSCFKKSVCLVLCFLISMSLSACSASTAMTEDNITKTVALVEKALKEFDKNTLKKYVDSQTLDYIISLAGKYDQYSKLGQAMFEKLEFEIKGIDLQNKTVTLSVKNRDMGKIAADFTEDLTEKYTPVQMLGLLGDEIFLNASLTKLTSQISEAIVPDNPTEITLNIEEGDKNLVLQFDSAAEDAVSGGVLTAITNVQSGLKAEE